MMSEEKLLELAAKAAGIESLWWTKDGNKLFQRNGGEQKPWNPLTDDGDALRLAVKLHMIIDPYAGAVAIPPGVVIATVRTGDEYAAVRYAIVRAAAEIGRSMK